MVGPEGRWRIGYPYSPGVAGHGTGLETDVSRESIEKSKVSK